MFGWRKKKDGFEWHKYVRTTIKLRREARREKAEQLKQQAAEGLRAAGEVAGDAARVGARKLGEGSRVAAAAAGTSLGLAGRLGLGALAVGARTAGRLLGTMVDALRRLPAAFAKLSPRGRIATVFGVALGLVAVLSALAGLLGLGPQRFAEFPTSSILSPRTVEGRAQAAGPDTLRVGQALVRLADIEAPEREQRCSRPGNKRWRCGESAAAALGRLVTGKQIKCDIRGADPAGVPLAVCREGTSDINAALVKGGHVFARSGLMAPYTGLEAEAKAAKLGLWVGEAERPSAYRARLWDEAKRRAPDGCPIKAPAQGQPRNYVLPWSPDYDRVRVNTSRGDRWFCSEQEAVAAGWRIARGG